MRLAISTPKYSSIANFDPSLTQLSSKTWPEAGKSGNQNYHYLHMLTYNFGLQIQMLRRGGLFTNTDADLCLCRIISAIILAAMVCNLDYGDII